MRRREFAEKNVSFFADQEVTRHHALHLCTRTTPDSCKVFASRARVVRCQTDTCRGLRAHPWLHSLFCECHLHLSRRLGRSEHSPQRRVLHTVCCDARRSQLGCTPVSVLPGRARTANAPSHLYLNASKLLGALVARQASTPRCFATCRVRRVAARSGAPHLHPCFRVSRARAHPPSTVTQPQVPTLTCCRRWFSSEPARPSEVSPCGGILRKNCELCSFSSPFAHSVQPPLPPAQFFCCCSRTEY